MPCRPAHLPPANPNSNRLHGHDGRSCHARSPNPNPNQAGGCVGSIPRGGCTVEAALSFDSLATFYVAAACVYPVYGCMLAGYGNYNPSATAADGSCADSGISGCTDSRSLCYSSNATVRRVLPPLSAAAPAH